MNEEGEAEQPAPFFRLETLKVRREFQQASGGPRFSTASFTMLRRLAPPAGMAIAPAAAGIRFGFTVTKKIGNAPVRNRIRRRLREAVRAAAPHFPKARLDFVILARNEVLRIEFSALSADIARAVAVLSTRDRPAPPRGERQTGRKSR